MLHNFLSKAVVRISTSDIRSYLSSNKDWQVGTIDRKLSVLKSFFGWLVQEELLLHNPCTKIKSPKKPKRLPKGLSIEELEIVRESCATLRERALMETMYSTACRLSEVSNIKISDIDFQNMSVGVVGKGDKERITYLSYKAMYHLKKYLNNRKENRFGKSDYLFIGERKPFSKLTGRSIERAIDKIEKRACISKKLTPHTLRHTFALLSTNQGVDLADLQHLLGHSNPSTTLIYTNVSEERKQRAFKRFHVQ